MTYNICLGLLLGMATLVLLITTVCECFNEQREPLNSYRSSQWHHRVYLEAESSRHSVEKETKLRKNKKREIHDKNKTKNCGICLSDITDSDNFSLSCRHEFHKKCLKQWLETQEASKNCPYCRRVVDNKIKSQIMS